MSEGLGLKKILLNLARTKEFPNGSKQHGYVFTVPLDADHHIDKTNWEKLRDHCRVHRFWGEEEKEDGHLILQQDGTWAFHYDIEGEIDDEAGYRFGAHPFIVGEYVSIHEEFGELTTFKVISVNDA